MLPPGFLSLILPKSQFASLEVLGPSVSWAPEYQLSIHGCEPHEIMKICLLHGIMGWTRHHGFSVSACTMKAGRRDEGWIIMHGFIGGRSHKYGRDTAFFQSNTVKCNYGISTILLKDWRVLSLQRNQQ